MPRQKITAKVMAIKIFNFKGSEKNTIAMTPPIKQEMSFSGDAAREHVTPTNANTPANPSPQSAGMCRAKAIPKRLAIIQLAQLRKQLPAK